MSEKILSSALGLSIGYGLLAIFLPSGDIFSQWWGAMTALLLFWLNTRKTS